jgi:phage baseplate assembly protein gpV
VSGFRRLSEFAERESRHKIFGVVVGIVTNNKDTDKGQYRVKVRFPWLPNGGEQQSEESDWCRIASMMAGNERGMYMLPEVGDEVLVAFEHGEIARPVVVGMLWNGKDKEVAHNKNGKNHVRMIRSRAGHVLEFYDDPDNARVTLISSKGALVQIDDKNEKITISTQNGTAYPKDVDASSLPSVTPGTENYVCIDKKGKKITLETTSGEILIKAKDKITLEAKEICTKSTADTKMDVGANFTMEAKSNMKLKASAQGNVESSATMTIKGATVNIN